MLIIIIIIIIIILYYYFFFSRDFISLIWKQKAILFKLFSIYISQ